MTDKQIALEAYDSAQKDRLFKAAGAYLDVFLTAEGNPNAAAQRQTAADRFSTALRIYGEARQGALALVDGAYPET